MGEKIDTSGDAVERRAAEFDAEAKHLLIAEEFDDYEHAKWCKWMAESAALLRALAAERDALREREDALCRARPDLAAILRGEAVAVPREATREMRRAANEYEMRCTAHLDRALGWIERLKP